MFFRAPASLTSAESIESPVAVSVGSCEDMAADCGDVQNAPAETCQRFTRNAETTVTSAVTFEPLVNTEEESEMVVGDGRCAGGEASTRLKHTGPTHKPPTADESLADSCDGTFDDEQLHTRPTARLTDKKLTYKPRRNLTSAFLGKRRSSAAGKSSRGMQSSSSWVPSKKLILEPCKSTGLEKKADGVADSTKHSRLTKKCLSLKSRRKQRDTTSERQMDEDAASQLAAEPRVIVSDIKREQDWLTTGPDIQSRSMLSTWETDDEETVVRETIVLASSPKPVSQCPAAATASTSSDDVTRRTRAEYEADARRLLEQYDGTQSVDVDELFDKHNQSEVIDRQVIQIDDDDEWSQMPNQLASVRFGLRSLYLYV